MAPTDGAALALEVLELVEAFDLDKLLELGREHAHRLDAVLHLAALGLATDHLPGGHVGNADRRLGLVDVLSTSTARLVGVDLQVFLVDLDLAHVVQFGGDLDGGETGLTTRIGIEGRDAH